MNNKTAKKIRKQAREVAIAEKLTPTLQKEYEKERKKSYKKERGQL